jgi:hypothetical protein
MSSHELVAARAGLQQAKQQLDEARTLSQSTGTEYKEWRSAGERVKAAERNLQLAEDEAPARLAARAELAEMEAERAGAMIAPFGAADRSRRSEKIPFPEIDTAVKVYSRTDGAWRVATVKGIHLAPETGADGNRHVMIKVYYLSYSGGLAVANKEVDLFGPEISSESGQSYLRENYETEIKALGARERRGGSRKKRNLRKSRRRKSRRRKSRKRKSRGRKSRKSKQRRR